jgi:hypothetical protein
MHAPRRLLAALLLLALAACGGDDDPTRPEPVEVDRIELTPFQAALFDVGTSRRFTARARTSAGAPVSDVAITWSSSNPDVATVTSSGLATATGFGSTVISARADGVTGRATLVVRDCTEALQLAPGQWVSLPVPQPGECGVVLPAGSAGDRFRVAVVRASGTTCTDGDCGGAGIDSVTVRTTLLDPPRSPADEPAPAFRRERERRPAARPRLPSPQLLASVRVAERTEALHRELRRDEQRLIERLRRQGDLAAALVRPPAAAPARQAATLPDRITLDDGTSSNCSAGEEVVGLKIYEDDRLAFYQDSVQRQTSRLRVSQAQARRMADFYRDYGEAVIDEYFDGVSDIDGNGKVIVFFTPMVRAGTAAFVWSGDFFTRESCAASNMGEYIYFSAGITTAQSDGNWQSLETLVHEMKHVSSLKKSVERPTGFEAYHPSWIEEGTAEIAANVASRRAWAAIGGPAENVRATGAMMSATGFVNGDITPEFYGMAIRMVRTQGYLASQPNGVTINPLGAGPDHSIYGSGFHFHRWLGDAFGAAASAPGAAAGLFATQNSSARRPGLAGLEEITGLSFAELMTEYAAAVLLNDDRFEVPPPARPFTTIDFASGVEIFCFAFSPGEWQEVVDGQSPGASPPCGYRQASQASGPDGTYPWPVTAAGGFGNEVPYGTHRYAGDIGNAGIRIHDFVSPGDGSRMEVQVEVDRQPEVARLVVARVN